MVCEFTEFVLGRGAIATGVRGFRRDFIVELRQLGSIVVTGVVVVSLTITTIVSARKPVSEEDKAFPVPDDRAAIVIPDLLPIPISVKGETSIDRKLDHRPFSPDTSR